MGSDIGDLLGDGEFNSARKTILVIAGRNVNDGGSAVGRRRRPVARSQ